LTSVNTAEAETQGIRRIFGAKGEYASCETIAIFWMHTLEKFVSPRTTIQLITENEVGIVAAARLARASIPFESNHFASCQSISQTLIAFLECCLFVPSLGEEGRKEERTS